MHKSVLPAHSRYSINICRIKFAFLISKSVSWGWSAWALWDLSHILRFKEFPRRFAPQPGQLLFSDGSLLCHWQKQLGWIETTWPNLHPPTPNTLSEAFSILFLSLTDANPYPQPALTGEGVKLLLPSPTSAVQSRAKPEGLGLCWQAHCMVGCGTEDCSAPQE